MEGTNQVGKRKLLENKAYYEHCLPIMYELYNRGLYEDCVGYIEKIASFCWLNFSGIYYSLEMENLLNKIGNSLPRFDHKMIKQSVNQNCRKVLHICSEVYITGGHSKLIYNWILNDNMSEHTLLSTRMSFENLNTISSRYLNRISVELVTLSQTTFLQRAQVLKEELYKKYDYIALHIHPDDPLCNLAFSDSAIDLPILFVNHADHVFWLGSTISRILIQLRQPFLKLDVERRQIDDAFYLPLPILQPQKENLTIVPGSSSDTPGELVILSIGVEMKFEPNEEYNFYKESVRIVETYKNVRIKIIGIKKNSEHAVKHRHDRIEYLGSLEYELLEAYRSHCDIYIEGFPMPSFTATLETMFFKKPAILHYNPRPLFQQFMPKKDNGLNYPTDLTAWRSLVDRVIIDEDYRNQLINTQYDFIKNEYSIKNWKARVECLYQECVSLTNTEKKFEQTEYSGDNEHILADFSSRKTNHLYGTTNLSILSKIKLIISKSPVIKSKTHKTSLKDKLVYLLPTEIKDFLRSFSSRLN